MTNEINQADLENWANSAAQILQGLSTWQASLNNQGKTKGLDSL